MAVDGGPPASSCWSTGTAWTRSTASARPRSAPIRRSPLRTICAWPASPRCTAERSPWPSWPTAPSVCPSRSAASYPTCPGPGEESPWLSSCATRAGSRTSSGPRVRPRHHRRIPTTLPSRFGLVRLAFGLRFRPGHHYDYSNTDNELVALMVQAATKRSYEHELAVRVTDPLGLARHHPPPDRGPARALCQWLRGGGRPVARGRDQRLFGRMELGVGRCRVHPCRRRPVRAGLCPGVLTVPAVHAEQFDFVPGSSEPPGPGTNSAGLRHLPLRHVLRHDLRPHGQHPRLHAVRGATEDGTRSVVVQVNGQVTPAEAHATAFADLLRVETSAVCAALEP